MRLLPDRATWPKGIPFYGGSFSNFVAPDGGLSVVVDPRQDLAVPELWDFVNGEGLLHIKAPTVEHFFQSAKAITLEDWDAILKPEDPWEAKRLGKATTLREDWEAVKYNIMLIGLRAKFSHTGLRAILLATRDLYIYEASPTDAVWGLWNPEEGAWTGQNLLGRGLMRVRAELGGGLKAWQ
jgi:ribA/ribD-fused uncharacterized protein